MATFTRSDKLRGAEFVNADLTGARFVGADLSDLVMRALDVAPFVEPKLHRRLPAAPTVGPEIAQTVRHLVMATATADELAATRESLGSRAQYDRPPVPACDPRGEREHHRFAVGDLDAIKAGSAT